MQVVELHLRPGPAQTYGVRIGPGALAALAEDLVAQWSRRRVVLVSDDTVAPLHAAPLRQRLIDRGLTVELLTFPAGEASKTRRTKAALEDRLYQLGVGRDCLIVGVGGGVTGDLAGFLAATWHRGVPLIHVPTSLLAMVDSSVGGKSGVNLGEGKNLVGSVHQPQGVYADVEVLETLPRNALRQGFSEVIKAATIADAGLFGWLESNAAALCGGSAAELEEAVCRSVRIKGAVVAEDELEAGRRMVLNFGHTVAHALEAASGYRVSHGEAVAVGMSVEARIATELTGFPREDVSRLDALLVAFGLPCVPPADIEFEAIRLLAARDKKVRQGEVHYALPESIGRMIDGAEVTVHADDDRLSRAWEAVTRGADAGS